MASSQAKTGRERLRTWKKKILVLIHSNPTWKREFQKDSKKIKKIKKTSLRLLFKPKWDGRGWECEEKKIIVPIHSNLTWNREFQKNSKNFQKIEKHQYGFFSSQNWTGEAENVRKKKFSFWSIPTRPGIGNSRKIAKKFKKLNNIITSSFQGKTGRDKLRMREKKNRSY